MDELQLVDGATLGRAQLETLTGAATLERHLARPRIGPGFTALARRGAIPLGYTLMAHTRFRLGTARLETLELTAFAAGDNPTREALLGAALSAGAAAGLPFISLRRNPAIFAGYGLAPCALRVHGLLALPRAGNGSPGFGADKAAPLREATGDDIDDLAALHSASYGELPLTPLRAAPDWRWTLAGNHGTLVMEDKSGRSVAYAMPAPGVGGLLIREAAAADSGAARQLLSALLMRAGQDGLGLALALPPEHRVARAALQLGAVLEVRAPGANDAARLWGVVDLVAALQALLPELTARLARSRYAGWTGRLLLESAGGPAALVFSAGQGLATAGNGPADMAIRRAQLGGLAQLLLGYRDAGDLRAAGALSCADSDLGLLDTLFPTLLAADAEPA